MEIVWKSYEKNAFLTGIPLTSKKNDDSDPFDIGFIKGLDLDPKNGPKRSLVLMNQIQTVSRKSVQIIRDAIDPTLQVFLNTPQQNLVNDMFVKQYIGRYLTLRNVLSQHIGMIPDPELTNWIADLDRPVCYKLAKNELFYLLSDETWRSVAVISLPVPLSKQKKLLHNMLSENTREQAIAEIQMILAKKEAAPSQEA